MASDIQDLCFEFMTNATEGCAVLIRVTVDGDIYIRAGETRGYGVFLRRIEKTGQEAYFDSESYLFIDEKQMVPWRTARTQGE